MNTTDDNTIAIQGLTPLALSRVLSLALGGTWGAVDVTLIADFLAMVDWSGKGSASSPMANNVGALQAWLTEYSEGSLSMDAFRSNVLSMLFSLGGKANIDEAQPSGIRISMTGASATEAAGTGWTMVAEQWPGALMPV